MATSYSGPFTQETLCPTAVNGARCRLSFSLWLARPAERPNEHPDRPRGAKPALRASRRWLCRIHGRIRWPPISPVPWDWFRPATRTRLLICRSRWRCPRETDPCTISRSIRPDGPRRSLCGSFQARERPRSSSMSLTGTARCSTPDIWKAAASRVWTSTTPAFGEMLRPSEVCGWRPAQPIRADRDADRFPAGRRPIGTPESFADRAPAI